MMWNGEREREREEREREREREIEREKFINIKQKTIQNTIQNRITIHIIPLEGLQSQGYKGDKKKKIIQAINSI